VVEKREKVRWEGIHKGVKTVRHKQYLNLKSALNDYQH